MSDTEILPIGSMVPLTGPSAADGVEFRNGVIMAVEEINGRGGVLGKKLKPFFVDTGRQSVEEMARATHKLIEQYGVHAIINGYNIGSQNSEYEAIADAGIIYIHTNTLLQHHDTVMSDPQRYFGCFMSDPAEYWYGQGLIKFISWLRDSKQWRPRNNHIAIISGAKPYSIVIAQAVATAAPHFGWVVTSGPHIVTNPASGWVDAIDQTRAGTPSVLVNTHYFAGDLARFQQEFVAKPMDCIVYLQYGAIHQSFVDLAGEAARGIIVSSMIGTLRDQMGQQFRQTYLERFGSGSTPLVGSQTYAATLHYALAVAQAGGSSGPGGADQNRIVADRLKNTIFRSVVGTIRYHAGWQAAVPYPDATDDPSLGMPHLFYQIQELDEERALIAPEPYNTSQFKLPPWMQK
ncbi:MULTISPECIES: ABC transporter substrate-binding protein [unclassified Bradyrhizobium]|uniref:ABC transporter substrate-binding protein n=1 Tax=unclassified Bradyrhizobium TaxID=2631580 RepID=UPI001FFFE824|nr:MULTISPECIES: ABC transporter substrate-binding protein [unclassified Bradyrhizobium]